MIATLEPRSPLDQWRQRLGGRRHRRAQLRPLAAMGYLANGPVIDGLVEVEKLTIILLYDEPIRPGHCALRLAGYSGSRVPWGVRFGGPGGDLDLPVRVDYSRPFTASDHAAWEREYAACVEIADPLFLAGRDPRVPPGAVSLLQSWDDEDWFLNWDRPLQEEEPGFAEGKEAQHVG